MLWSTKSVHQPLRRVLAAQILLANATVLDRINRMSVPYKHYKHYKQQETLEHDAKIRERDLTDLKAKFKDLPWNK